MRSNSPPRGLSQSGDSGSPVNATENGCAISQTFRNRVTSQESTNHERPHVYTKMVFDAHGVAFEFDACQEF